MSDQRDDNINNSVAASNDITSDEYICPYIQSIINDFICESDAAAAYDNMTTEWHFGDGDDSQDIVITPLGNSASLNATLSGQLMAGSTRPTDGENEVQIIGEVSASTGAIPKRRTSFQKRLDDYRDVENEYMSYDAVLPERDRERGDEIEWSVPMDDERAYRLREREPVHQNLMVTLRAYSGDKLRDTLERHEERQTPYIRDYAADVDARFPHVFIIERGHSG